MTESHHRAQPAAENASPTNSGCAGFDDRLKIHYVFPVVLQQQWKRIITATFVLVPEPTASKPAISTISSLRAPPSTSSASRAIPELIPHPSPRKPRNLANRNLFASHPDHLVQFRLKQMSRRQVGSILAGTPPSISHQWFLRGGGILLCRIQGTENDYQ
ncbi:MAG: hypothetical protein C5S48_07695 [Candidatus Methanogaster sp.]|nr:MAG: hypothetical protein C5S48_07695 [ANME-2 cluster archaeon]